VRPAMGFGHAQIGQHQRQRLGCHRGSAIRVYGQRTCDDALLLAGCPVRPFRVEQPSSPPHCG
jgi:hypothetical protein